MYPEIVINLPSKTHIVTLLYFIEHTLISIITGVGRDVVYIG